MTQAPEGATVYVYGHQAATVIEAYEDGAIVREHDDNSETWFGWDALTLRPWPDHRDGQAAR